MKRDEARKIIKNLKMQLANEPLWGRYAGTLSRIELIRTLEAIDVLTAQMTPWVKTAERLPTEADANEYGYVLVYCALADREGDRVNMTHIAYIKAKPEFYPLWSSIPRLPKEMR